MRVARLTRLRSRARRCANRFLACLLIWDDIIEPAPACLPLKSPGLLEAARARPGLTPRPPRVGLLEPRVPRRLIGAAGESCPLLSHSWLLPRASSGSPSSPSLAACVSGGRGACRSATSGATVSGEEHRFFGDRRHVGLPRYQKLETLARR